jgi:hypothetical protein
VTAAIRRVEERGLLADLVSRICGVRVGGHCL